MKPALLGGIVVGVAALAGLAFAGSGSSSSDDDGKGNDNDSTKPVKKPVGRSGPSTPIHVQPDPGHEDPDPPEADDTSDPEDGNNWKWVANATGGGGHYEWKGEGGEAKGPPQPGWRQVWVEDPDKPENSHYEWQFAEPAEEDDGDTYASETERHEHDYGYTKATVPAGYTLQKDGSIKYNPKDPYWADFDEAHKPVEGNNGEIGDGGDSPFTDVDPNMVDPSMGNNTGTGEGGTVEDSGNFFDSMFSSDDSTSGDDDSEDETCDVIGALIEHGFNNSPDAGFRLLQFCPDLTEDDFTLDHFLGSECLEDLLDAVARDGLEIQDEEYVDL